MAQGGSHLSVFAPLCPPSLKVEYDKLANEKTEMQRHYVMVRDFNQIADQALNVINPAGGRGHTHTQRDIPVEHLAPSPRNLGTPIWAVEDSLLTLPSLPWLPGLVSTPLSGDSGVGAHTHMTGVVWRG